MHINFKGRLEDTKEVRAGFIGCGSHSFRNVYPVLQFAPVNLVAVCDLDPAKAEAFAAQFGAEHAYDSHHTMLEKEELDAVFIVTGYDESGRPTYPALVADCMRAGRHVWIEKPPAATCAEIEKMQAVSRETGTHVLVGMKKMFFPSLVKAKELTEEPDFGAVRLVTTTYPQYIPDTDEMSRYLVRRERVASVVGFLDHLCHPMSRLVYLLGNPETMFYQRAVSGAGAATFTYADGAVATLLLTHGQSHNGGMEHTTIVGEKGHHITIENNLKVTYHRNPEITDGYGATASYYGSGPEEVSAVWEPEFSLGQLYNKGLFMLGYYSEVEEFARCVLEDRPPENGTLEQARQVTRVFEAFAEGPGRVIRL